jgi:hypothetical protein
MSWVVHSGLTHETRLVRRGPMAKVLSHVMDFAALRSIRMRGVLGGLAEHFSIRREIKRYATLSGRMI